VIETNGEALHGRVSRSHGITDASPAEFSSYIEDLGYEPVLPVGGDDFDDGGYHHEDLDRPQSGLPTKLVDGPTTDEENGNQGSGISG
jgi:hypothetical protein